MKEYIYFSRFQLYARAYVRIWTLHCAKARAGALFFLLSSQLSRRTREETLDTQAATIVKVLACVASVSVRFRSKE